MFAYYNDSNPYCCEWLEGLIADRVIPLGIVDSRPIQKVSSDEIKNYTQVHLFAGIGGWAYALRLAGWPDDRPIWTGSCPCQPFSNAGLRKGFSDKRHLWPYMYRLVRRVRPPVIMGEQVAAKAGYAWFDRVQSDLAKEDYQSRAVDIPACSVNAPHIRNRLYWVADPNKQRLEIPQSKPEDAFQECQAIKRDSWSGGLGDSSGNQQWGEIRPEQQRTFKARGPSSVGFWDVQEIIGPDRRGYSRRIKPGLCTLAIRVPSTVHKLAALGNSIVPELAAEVIRAYMETSDRR